MLNNISLPSVTEESLNSAKERKAILDALYALSEQLRRTYNNIDEESFSPAYLAKVQQTQEAAASVGVLREQLISAREALLKEIAAKATAVEDKFMSEIYTDESRETKKFVQQTDYDTTIGEFQQTLSSTVQQNAIQLLLTFQDTLVNEDGTPIELDGASLSELMTRFTFSQNGLIINRAGEKPYVQLDNKEISFQRDVDGTVDRLAYLSATAGLYAKLITGDDIVMGNSISAEKSISAGRFKFIDEGALGFSLVKEE